MPDPIPGSCSDFFFHSGKKDNSYGKSKRKSKEILVNWANQKGGKVTGLIISNVFGAFGKPFYNSFISTFCFQLIHNEIPKIINDAKVELIYVGELIDKMIECIRLGENNPELYLLPASIKKVTEVLELLLNHKIKYFDRGKVPISKNQFENNLFNIFRSYINYKSRFPIKLGQHTDSRGTFVEIIRLGIGGQCSFSTTAFGITRGNHYHTRKIERFAVIKGESVNPASENRHKRGAEFFSRRERTSVC